MQDAEQVLAFRNGSSPSSAYSGATDTTISYAAPNENFGSATTCEATGDAGSGTDTSCLLRWDIVDVPAGVRVTSASITLEVVDGSPDTYEVYALERTFEGAEATWKTASSSEAWGRPGAAGVSDRGAHLGSISAESGSQSIELDATGVELVQRWMDGEGNGGLIIENTASTDAVAFASSEAEDSALRPKLEITYRLTTASEGSKRILGDDTPIVFTSDGTAETPSVGDTDSAVGAGPAREPTVLVAFIGDQGFTDNSLAVLQLIAAEGADAVVHNGDFDYVGNPAAWDERIDSVLGANFPYFAVVGNHDAPAWYGPDGYAARIAARHARVPEMECTGELGVRANCYFRGVHFVQSCIGTDELSAACAKDSPDQVAFIQHSLENATGPFSICNWHKNQHDMQVGYKNDAVGWEAYRACVREGAIIATGHEHSYSRTLAMDVNIGDAAASHGAHGAYDSIELGSGRSFAFVSGLAGYGVRDFVLDAHGDDTWWASYYAANRWVKNGERMEGTGTYGALFIEFYAGGYPNRARAYFKDLNQRIADEFTIEVR